uniref:Restriction endonuclease n=1 Tax=Candidatus Kentrum sp. TC TaxID=2126339 RepID=A0A450Z8Z2_9GAMM|nr:MAG: Putative restriction endonuclease [Candidatus Kentron sp. TC]VFK62957.1 MAG: Putative restriction endonuclease [Candidatus Kentron sp. TC]
MQSPIRLGDFSEPQADIVIARPREDFYRRNHPVPADILLIIEAAEHSLRYDRAIEGPLYARYGIPEYWLVDLPGRCLEYYRSPGSTDYLDTSRHLTGEILSSYPHLAVQLDLPALSLSIGVVFG